MTGPGPSPIPSLGVDSGAHDAVDSSPASTSTSGERAAPSSLSVSLVDSDSTAGSGPGGSLPSSPRVYSPSETSTWLTCPILRQFKKSWTAREVMWEPARLLGIAVQEGLSRSLRGGDDVGIEQGVISTLTAGFQEQAKYSLPGLIKIALRGVEVALAVDLFHRHAILMVDEPLSHSRPDVVSRHETEGLGVTDFKVSQEVKEHYRAKRMSEYETDDQFWHYAWEVGETLGEPVKWVRPVLIILTPKALVLQESIRVSPERLSFWLQGAEQHWKDMQAEDEGTRPVVPRWPQCRGGRFGVCEAYDFCHVLDRDPIKATVYYDNV